MPFCDFRTVIDRRRLNVNRPTWSRRLGGREGLAGSRARPRRRGVAAGGPSEEEVPGFGGLGRQPTRCTAPARGVRGPWSLVAGRVWPPSKPASAARFAWLECTRNRRRLWRGDMRLTNRTPRWRGHGPPSKTASQTAWALLGPSLADGVRPGPAARGGGGALASAGAPARPDGNLGDERSTREGFPRDPLSSKTTTLYRLVFSRLCTALGRFILAVPAMTPAPRAAARRGAPQAR